VGLLLADQELGGVGVRVQRVGGDDRPGKVQRLQQGLEGGDLAGGAVDLVLGQHTAGGVVHRGQQVDLAAVVFGASQRLAIDRDCPPPLPLEAVAVAKPGADRCGQGLGVQAAQGPADGGFGRDAVVAGSVVAGAERGTDWLGSLGGPFGDRGHRAGAGKHRGGGHGQDGDQWVAAPTRGSRVGDAGQVGEQVRSLGLLERVGIAQRVKTRWDRG